MDNAPPEERLPPSLRFLKGLVIVLTLTMIVGVIAVAATLVTRMPGMMQQSLPLPDKITLPSGVQAQAFTQGAAWYAVVTTDDHILIFNRKTGALTQDIPINAAATGP
jgi:Family of unknown function (DUF6476)